MFIGRKLSKKKKKKEWQKELYLILKKRQVKQSIRIGRVQFGYAEQKRKG